METPLPDSVKSIVDAEATSNICGDTEAAKKTVAAVGKPGGYGLYTGVPGNTSAASWQPCLVKGLESAGWNKAIEGFTQWTPQGMTQAANSLYASGTNPAAIAYDYTMEYFAAPYLKDGKTPPILISDAVNSAFLKQAKDVQAQNVNIQGFTANARSWYGRIGLTAGILLKQGQPVDKQIDIPYPTASISDILPTPTRPCLRTLRCPRRSTPPRRLRSSGPGPDHVTRGPGRTVRRRPTDRGTTPEELDAMTHDAAPAVGDVTATGGAGESAAATAGVSIIGVSKTFPGVRALSNADFDCLPGEVHALVGENGSGKSTMIKVPRVSTHPTGHVLIGGQALGATGSSARKLGLITAYQDTSLVGPQCRRQHRPFLQRPRHVARPIWTASCPPTNCHSHIGHGGGARTRCPAAARGGPRDEPPSACADARRADRCPRHAVRRASGGD